MQAARSLLQKGLRQLPDSAELWLSFFKIELSFLDALTERHQSLGIVDSSDKTLAALLVYNHALASLTNSKDYQKDFVDIASAYKEKYPEFFKQFCKNSLQNHNTLSSQTALMIFNALYQADGPFTDLLSMILDAFNDAFDKSGNFEFIKESIKFLYSLLDQCPFIRDVLVDKIDQLCQQLQDETTLSPDLYLIWFNVLEKCDGIKLRSLLLQALNENPKSDLLWTYFVKTELDHPSPDYQLLVRAISSSPTLKESLQLLIAESVVAIESDEKCLSICQVLS